MATIVRDLPFGSPEHLSFDSDALPKTERFARYRSLYSGGADVAEYGPHFRALVQGWRLDRALVFDRHLNDVAHSRNAARVAHDAFDHFTLTAVQSGSLQVDSGDGFHRLMPGRAVLLDMRATMASRSSAAHFITVSMARERVIAAAGSTEGLHGLVLDHTKSRLLTDFLASLIMRIEDLPTASGASAAQALNLLLAIALEDRQAIGDDEQIAQLDSARIGRIRRLIDLSLGDPAFGPEAVIAQSSLSRATLYRVFKAHGGLGSYIQRRRLDRLRVMLSDPADNRTFAQLAFAAGFASEGHCSRLFHDRFGMRPGEYRAAMLASRDDPDPGRRLGFWQDEIR